MVLLCGNMKAQESQQEALILEENIMKIELIEEYQDHNLIFITMNNIKNIDYYVTMLYNIISFQFFDN